VVWNFLDHQLFFLFKQDEGDYHWESRDFLYGLALNKLEKLQKLAIKQMPSLADLCIKCFFHNQRCYSSRDVLQLPYLVQDHLVELLCEKETKKECLDLFLSEATYHLCLPFCSLVTDQFVQRAAQRCTGMKELILKGFVHLSDQSLEQIALYCTSIKVLDLSYCHNITDYGVIKLVQNCIKLQKLCLHRCSKITHLALVQMGRYSKKLRVIDITGTRFCQDSLRYLIQNCLQLSTLVIYNTPLTPVAVLRMIQGSTDYEYLDSFQKPTDILISAVEATNPIEKSKGDTISLSLLIPPAQVF